MNSTHNPGHRRLGLMLLACFTLFTLCVGTSQAAMHKKIEKKVGILLVAFGSSEESAQVSFENMDKKVKAAFPDVPVRWAYTSHIIRKKLAKQGKLLDSPAVALAKMQDEGFTHVAVQSLHTIAGEEFHDLTKTVSGFRTMGAFQSIILGYPMLGNQDDMARAVKGILATIPKERKKDEAVVLMGHGTPHPGNAFYAALMFQVQLQDPNVFIGTVEGYPTAEDILKLMQAKEIKKAYVMPFMSVAGDHAKNDMAGKEDDSWVSMFTQSGINCDPILKGTAEYDEFADIWIDHVKTIMAHFK